MDAGTLLSDRHRLEHPVDRGATGAAAAGQPLAPFAPFAAPPPLDDPTVPLTVVRKHGIDRKRLALLTISTVLLVALVGLFAWSPWSARSPQDPEAVGQSSADAAGNDAESTGEATSAGPSAPHASGDRRPAFAAAG